MQWEPLTTMEAVRAALDAGRHVEYTVWPSDTYDMPRCDEPESGGWVPIAGMDEAPEIMGSSKYRAALSRSPTQ